jgi:hypothetical protein
MNLQAAEIAWTIAMEHNAIHRGLDLIIHAKDDDYQAEKERFFKVMYKVVARILESNEPLDDLLKEFLSRTINFYWNYFWNNLLKEVIQLPEPERTCAVVVEPCAGYLLHFQPNLSASARRSLFRGLRAFGRKTLVL